jgi:hypothetical protein
VHFAAANFGMFHRMDPPCTAAEAEEGTRSAAEAARGGASCGGSRGR